MWRYLRIFGLYKNKEFKRYGNFKIRTYGRTELAQLYSPGLCPQAAFRKLNQWIDFHPTLRSSLHALVASDKTRTYTPAQVRLIVEALGEP